MDQAGMERNRNSVVPHGDDSMMSVYSMPQAMRVSQSAAAIRAKLNQHEWRSLQTFMIPLRL